MPDERTRRPVSPPEMHDYYRDTDEDRRLAVGPGPLELARTQEIVRRYLPPPPAAVLDVGGGPGVYARWLAGLGYEVTLVDPVPRHIEQARRASAGHSDRPVRAVQVGDARRLEQPGDSAAAILMLGPLYHLVDREDRLRALREAHRVLAPGGRLCAAVISRFASTLDGLARELLADPQFARIVDRDLRDGQHRNPTGNTQYFTTAFFHHPEELAAELREAGFEHETTLAVEGPGWLLADLEARMRNAERRRLLLDALRRIEAEPALLGVSAHMLGVARKGGARGS